MQTHDNPQSIHTPYQTSDYRELFENSPIALWEYDITAVYAHIQKLRERGVSDFAVYFHNHPEEIEFCVRSLHSFNVNPVAVELFEAANKEELLINPAYFLREAGFEFFMDALVAFAEGTTNFEVELFCYTLKDKKLRVILRSHLIPGLAGNFNKVIVSITDITPQYEASIELNRKNEQLKILHSISLAVLSAQSPSEIVRVALQDISKITDCDIATIVLYDFENNAGTLLNLEGAEPPQQNRFPLTQWALFDTLRTGKYHYIRDFKKLNPTPAIYQNLAAAGLRAMVNVPIFAQGELVGTLALLAYKPSSFSNENIQNAEQIAAALSVSFHNAKLLEVEQRAHHQAKTLREVALNMNSNLDLEALLEVILDQLARVVAYDAVYIVLKTSNTYEFASQRNLHPITAQMLTKEIHKFANIQEILRNQRPLLIQDVSVYPDWVKMDSYSQIHCWLGVPIRFKDKFIGFLALEKAEAGYYIETDKDIVQAFANQAAIAIENARLYQRIQQYSAKLETRVQERTRELQVLYNVTAVAGKPLGLKNILQNTLAELDSMLNIATSAIHIYDIENEQLYLACQHGLGKLLTQQIQIISLPDKLFGHVLIKDNAHVVEINAKQEPPLAEQTHFAGIPIHAKGKTIGVLTVFGSSVPALKTEDLALLGTVADHIGSSIENNNLSKKAQQLAVLQERKRLAQDLHDSITQSLYSMTLFAEAAHDLASVGDMVGVQKQIQEINLSAQQAFKEMRLMLHELRADSLSLIPNGLEHALRQHIETIEGRTGQQFSLSIDSPINLPQSVQETLFRIAQEALNNTWKHANAQTVTLSISFDNDELIMLINDDGDGFDPQKAQHQHGMGLTIMQERAAEIDATCTYTSYPLHGTSIQVNLPLHQSIFAEMTK